MWFFYSIFHFRNLLFLALGSYVLCSFGYCQDAGSKFERFQQEPFRLEDRFREDTTKKYQINGSVTHTDLEVELAPSSSLAFVKTLDGTFSYELDLWPREFESGERSVSQVHLHLANHWRITISIFRAIAQGRIYRQVIVTEFLGGQPMTRPIVTELRRTSAFTLSEDVERWVIKYHFGLLELSCGGKKVCSAYTNAFSSWLNGVSLSQQGKEITLSRFMLAGKTNGYSTQQRELFNKVNELRLQAKLAADAGDLSRSLKIEKSIIPLAEKCNGKNSFINGIFHQTIGDRLGTLALHEKSKEAHEKSASIFRSYLGANHPETLQAEMYVADKLVQAEELDKGASMMRRAVLKYARISGVKARNSQAMLTRLNQVIRMQAEKSLRNKDYDKYRKLLADVFAITKQAYSSDHWQIRDAMLDLEFAEQLMNATGQELEKLEEYLQVRMDVFKQTKEISPAVENERKDLLLSLIREVHGNLHPMTARALLALSIDRFNQGEADISMSMLQEAMKIYQEFSDGENDPRYIYASGQLGAQLSMMQRYAEASELLEQACQQLQEKGHNHKVEYADMLLEYGRHLIRLGDPNGAEMHLQNAFQLYRSLGQPTHPNALKTCERLADVYRAKGAIRQAKDMLNYHRNLVISAYGEDSSHYIDILSSEARLLYMRKKHNQAVEKYQEAIALIEEKYGKRSRAYEAILNGLIDVYVALGNGHAAIKHFGERLEFELYRREALFNVYSEQGQFARSLHDLYALNPLIILTLEGYMQADQAYEYAVAFKGAVTAWQRVARIANRDPKITELHEAKKKLESQIVAMESQGTAKSLKSRYNKLVSQRERLQTQLLKTSRNYQIASKETSVKDLQKLLPSGTVIIDYYEYEKPKSFWDNALFRQPKVGLVAFVLNREKGVQLVDLGSAQKVFQAWEAWQSAMQIEPFYELQSKDKTLSELIDEQGELLRKLIWDPLVEHLGEADTVLVSPSLHLSACPFAALPSTKKDSYLIEQFAFATITTPRLLPELLIPREAPASPRLLLVGDIDYNASPTKTAEKFSSDTGHRANVAFSKLPKADQELRPILTAYVNRFRSTDFKQLRGKQASETMFRQNLPGANYIHLHTHGFCLSLAELEQMRKGQSQNSPEEYSFLVSGIALAGGNRGVYSKTPTDSDGILWAAEIEQLDFSEAELVTLSACQTAIGNLVSGEGMLGAQRALHVAGARSSLTALWAVNDATTRTLMQQFYRQHWKEKQPKAKALQQAMIYMLRKYDWQKELELDSSSQRTPPTYWAGFVLHGDWR